MACSAGSAPFAELLFARRHSCSSFAQTERLYAHSGARRSIACRATRTYANDELAHIHDPYGACFVSARSRARASSCRSITLSPACQEAPGRRTCSIMASRPSSTYVQHACASKQGVCLYASTYAYCVWFHHVDGSQMRIYILHNLCRAHLLRRKSRSGPHIYWFEVNGNMKNVE
jgi:hypothetical protein